MLVEAFGDHALGRTQCFSWFKKFQRGDFDVKNEAHRRPARKFEDHQLQALLDENDSQTQQLADQLGVGQEIISRRLRAMGKIQKLGKCVPYELTEQQQENRKTIYVMLFARYRKKSFLHRRVIKNRYTSTTPSAKNHRRVLEKPRNRLPGQIASEKRLYCVFGGIGKA